MSSIPVFFGGGTRYTVLQAEVFAAVCSVLEARNLQPILYPRDEWNPSDPLRGIVECVRTCFGCLLFGIPRYYAPELYEFPQSEKQLQRSGIVLPTVWDYIETTAAYVLGMPVLSIIDQTISTQGILSPNYESYHVYRCLLTDNYPQLSSELHRQLDDYAARVWAYYHSTCQGG